MLVLTNNQLVQLVGLHYINIKVDKVDSLETFYVSSTYTLAVRKNKAAIKQCHSSESRPSLAGKISFGESSPSFPGDCISLDQAY